MDATDIDTDVELVPSRLNEAGERIKYLGCFP